MKVQKRNFKLYIILGGIFAFLLFFGITPSVSSYEEIEYIDAIVIFKQDVNINEISGIKYKYQWDALNGFAAKLPYPIYKELEKSPFVETICIDTKVVVSMNDILDWGVDHINAEKVWGGSENAVDVLPGNVAGEGINILVCDSGFEFTHDDINNNWVDGYNWVNGREYDDVIDYNGHGTYCAGLIMAEDNGWGVIGVAPKANLFGARVLDNAGHGEISDVMEAIYWGTFPNERDYGQEYPRMDIISMSFGWTSPDSAFEAMCDLAYNNGVVLVASSGNSPPLPVNQLAFPAQFQSVISVGAVYQDNTKCDFSCYDSKLDIVAPGYDIYSTWLNNDFKTDSGTSAACPLVAGVCALVLSANNNLNPSQVAYCIYSSSQNIDNIYSSNDDLFYGHGLVRADWAVDLAENLDIVNPCVSITNPFSSLVHDTVLIRAAACSDEEITSVEFQIDSDLIKTDNKGEDGWTCYWDTTTKDNGEYTITCRAYDVSGHGGITQKIVQVLNGGGSGECPNLLVWDGEMFVDEGVLEIHNEDNSEEDMVVDHVLDTNPALLENNKYALKLAEIAEGFNVSHSTINQVELHAREENGQWIKCPLTLAVHSTMGNVKSKLLNEDNKYVDTFKGDEILLEFQAFNKKNFVEFVFTIVGHNKHKA